MPDGCAVPSSFYTWQRFAAIVGQALSPALSPANPPSTKANRLDSTQAGADRILLHIANGPQ
jgi:hypothetical protein